MGIRHRGIVAGVGAIGIAALVLAVWATGSAPRDGSAGYRFVRSAAVAPARTAAAGRGFTASVTYHEIDHGTSKGPATTGITGTGRFAAKLGGATAAGAAIIAAATGVPVTKIAAGGSYKVRRSFDAQGGVSGLVLATFKAHGLGTVCVSYTQRLGHYMPGEPAVPMIGTFTTVGGTGPAARWRVTIRFTQTTVSGLATERLGGQGTEQNVSVGGPRPLSAACKRLARI